MPKTTRKQRKQTKTSKPTFATAAAAAQPASTVKHPARLAAKPATSPSGSAAPKKKWFRPGTRVKHPGKLPPAWQIARTAILTLYRNWKLFAVITLIYAVLTILLVRGLGSNADLSTLKSVLSGSVSKLAASLGVFALLVSSSGTNAGPAAGVYQSFLFIIISLAIVWTLRQVFAGVPQIRVRDAFYQGMYPLVTVILVSLTMLLKLLPFLIGASVYSLVINNGIASLPIEQILWGLLVFVLTLVSLYLLTSSVFALYIAALPDMTPMKALRSARELVRHRRWTVLRKLLFLPLVLLLAAMIVMLPIILLATSAAPWVFFVLTMIGLPIVHAYIYSLYRELLA